MHACEVKAWDLQVQTDVAEQEELQRQCVVVGLTAWTLAEYYKKIALPTDKLPC